VKRLYQWLHERATFFRSDSHDGQGRRVVRTEVTVEEERSTLFLSVSGTAGVCVCPLCGNPYRAATVLEGPMHADCPQNELPEAKLDPLPATVVKTEKAVRRLR
jgi:hypothetical protein